MRPRTVFQTFQRAIPAPRSMATLGGRLFTSRGLWTRQCSFPIPGRFGRALRPHAGGGQANRTVKAPPKTGQNAAPGGISRPQLALRGITWHKPRALDLVGVGTPPRFPPARCTSSDLLGPLGRFSQRGFSLPFAARPRCVDSLSSFVPLPLPDVRRRATLPASSICSACISRRTPDAKSSEGSPRAPNSHELPRTLTCSSPVSRTPASSLGGRRGAIAASRGRDRFAPDSPHRQAGRPT